MGMTFESIISLLWTDDGEQIVALNTIILLNSYTHGMGMGCQPRPRTLELMAADTCLNPLPYRGVPLFM